MVRRLCMGNQALAYGALRAGVKVVTGYPGTPSSEVLQTVSVEVQAQSLTDIHVEWSTNEKTALEVAIGASFAGARAMVTMKQVGLNVAADALMSLPYLGVKGGLVLIVADDPGPISSQTEQDTRQFAGFAKVPVFDPSTPEEAHSMIQEAFELSERYTTPVIVRPTTRVCHGSAAISTDYKVLNRENSSGDEGEPGATDDVAKAVDSVSGSTSDSAPGFERSPDWVIFPGRAHRGHLEIWDRLPKIAAEWTSSPFNEVRNTHASAPSHLGIAAGGISYAYLNDALASLKHVGALRLFKVGTPFPFPTQSALQFLEGLSEVLVLEELEPVIERELLMLAGQRGIKVKILGRLTGHTAVAGENSVASITKQIRKFCDLDFFDRAIDIKPALTSGSSDVMAPELPDRPPVLCAGCPHRASFYAVKRALKGRKAVFSGDIGCYTLGNALPLDMVDTCLCMGAGFTIPQGMDRVEPDILHLGFLGDSTFFASGLSGVTNAVYNRSNVTFCILDNSTTAMTGSQPHPGTGVRMSADADARDAENALRIPDVLCALGVKRVQTVNPFDQTQAQEAVLAAVEAEGVSAIVFKAPCITVAPPEPKPVIEASRCTYCKLCVKQIGCPALIEKHGKIAVDTALCYGCDLCVPICPTGAIRSARQAAAPVPQNGDIDG